MRAKVYKMGGMVPEDILFLKNRLVQQAFALLLLIGQKFIIFCAQSAITIYPTHFVTSYTELVFPHQSPNKNRGEINVMVSCRKVSKVAEENAKFSMNTR